MKRLFADDAFEGKSVLVTGATSGIGECMIKGTSKNPRFDRG